MRPTLVLIALALAVAGPAYASEDGATGGVTVPRGATGGLAVPGESAPGGTQGDAPTPGGGAPPAASGGRREGAAPADSPAGSAAPVRARAAQEGQPGAPPPQQQPESGDVEVQVPVDEGAPESSAPRPAPSATPFGGLAPTGLAVAAFGLLGAAAAALGLGLRRLARQSTG